MEQTEQNVLENQQPERTRIDWDNLEETLPAWLNENWQRLLFGAGVVVLGFWAFDSYQTGRAKMLDETSYAFVQAQQAFNQLPVATEPVQEVNAETDSKEPEAKASDGIGAETATAFSDTMGLLANNAGSRIYGDLGKLYLAAFALKSGDVSKAEGQLASFNLAGIEEPANVLAEDEMTSTQLVQELALYLTARTKLFSQPAQVEEARSLLRTLVKGGQLLTVEALNTLLRLSSNEIEQTRVKALGEELIDKRPGLSEVVKSTFEQAGVPLT